MGGHICFFMIYFALSSMRFFEYQGIDFDVVKEKDVTFFHTSFPIYYQGKEITYNVFMG